MKQPVAFIFPGQGSQKVGMGAELAHNYPIARTVFDEAETQLGKPLGALCFNGPAEKLKQTENTQLAILTCSIAAWRVLNQLGILPDAVAGHSLGEYSALVAAGALDFSDALTLVQARAQAMAEAGEKRPGTMAAFLGMEAAHLQILCQKTKGIVNIANYNCPGQLVISGEVDAVNAVVNFAKTDIGARRCRLLPVSGAFHSPLMGFAQRQFEPILRDVRLRQPQIDVAMNVNGNFVSHPEDIRRLLFQQITAPVQWEQCLKTIASTGISHFVEVGPSKVLSGLVNRTLPGSTTVNVEDLKSLQECIGSL